MKATGLDLTKAVLRDVVFQGGNPGKASMVFGKQGGGISLFPAEQLAVCRWLSGIVLVEETHSVVLELRFFTASREEAQIRFVLGVLPGIPVRICLDLSLMDARTIFTPRTPGSLKMVVHGNRTQPAEVIRVEMGIRKCFQDVRMTLEDFTLSQEMPDHWPDPGVTLVDALGQWVPGNWPGKLPGEEAVSAHLRAVTAYEALPMPGKSRWGGDADRKLTGGTGCFATVKTSDGRWHLVDPEGYEFFSVGCDCVRCGDPVRTDVYPEGMLVLPPRQDPLLADCYSEWTRARSPHMAAEHQVLFNYTMAHFKKTYGEAWHSQWRKAAENILLQGGFNTVANWSDQVLQSRDARIPYVWQPSEYPSTEQLIFRDFPDVLAPAYDAASQTFAEQLKSRAGDPWMIGYFMRNEPEFAFVPGLLIAAEVLRCPEETHSRAGVIRWLKDKYQTIQALNQTWHSHFSDFGDLGIPVPDCARSWPLSVPDLKELSDMLIRAYVGIPAEACRRADPKHLNLGMRWAQADTPEQLAGWEFFDVFSVNCYSFDPGEVLDFVAASGVDLPVMIGEFHFGALDRGVPATGLKGVATQMDRASAFRGYLEACAAHPLAVGAHWFQFNDQSALGRFDGENYQIGLVDVCMQPYDEMLEAARAASRCACAVHNGEQTPWKGSPETIPMIAY